jgi:5'-nucleotidase / UDP-sugar diphosphatase
MITILHTNDIHGHLTSWRGWIGEWKDKQVGGLDRVATAVDRVRGEGTPVLLLDAGDLIGDTMIADLTAGEALIRAFNAIGYDALVPGNHEPDFGDRRLAELIAMAEFSVLAANLRRDNGEWLARPYMVKELAGTKVGVIGLAYPKTPSTTAPKNVAELRFDPPAEVAKAYVEELRRQGVEIVIALTHLGLGADIELAERVPGIDVIVGGHSHNRMSEPLRIGATLIVQAGAHGSDLGRLDLYIDGGRVKHHRRELYPLVHDEVKADPRTADLIEELVAPHRKALEERIGQAADWLIRAQTLAGQEPHKRDEQSPVDSLFADILRQKTGAAIAFLPGVGYGVAIPPGPITAAQLRQLIPHDGKVVTMRLSATQVRDVLEQAIENVFTDDSDRKVGGMIQISGLRITYDPELAPGKRIVDIHLEDDTWAADKEYLIATNAMLAAGGHHQKTFTRGTSRTEHESQYEIVKAAFQSRHSVSTPGDNRIQKVDTQRE